ncbi:hypothetical protein MJN51_39135, partial [Salmonella enterica subsp. enterica serovar Kentucky]|nr:hypothetical protein [Salmonella enterica subsp. enterica serovar Kentucky]
EEDAAVDDLLASVSQPKRDFSDDEIIARMMIPMINEVVRCLEHGDFQSPALPTELSGQRGALNRNRLASSTKFLQINVDCTIYH